MEDEKARYVFKVSDGIPAGVDGREKPLDPFIWLEPSDRTLSILKERNMSLGFLLREGASQREADEIADYLNKHIRALTIW